MGIKSADRLLLLGGTTSFLGFLLLEPFKPEILSYFAGGIAHGWIAFVSLRLLLLLLALVSFIFASPQRDDCTARLVPMPLPGGDPLLTLRAFAFIMVMAGHGLVVVFPPADISQLLQSGNEIWLAMGSPWAAVWIFFVLSGYLMAKGFYSGRYDLSRAQIIAFYSNRIRRIAPIYYLVLFITALFASPDIFRPANWWEIVALAAFSQQNGSPHPVVAALWSIQTEMAFYAAVPLLFLAVKKLTSRYPVWLLAGMLLALGWGYRSYVMYATGGLGWLDRVYIPLIGNLDLFLLGICANWALPSFQRRLRSVPTLSIGLAMLVPLYLAATYFFCRSLYGFNAQYFGAAIQICGPSLVGLTTFLIIILFEHHTGTKMRAGLISEQMVRRTQALGLLTYALYAWHEPIFLLLRTAASPRLTITDAILWLGAAFALTAAVSLVSNKLLEAVLEARRSAAMPRHVKNPFKS